MSRDALQFPDSYRVLLEPFLPSNSNPSNAELCTATLTFATSLDSALSLSPGVQTALSGPFSKAMTHYLRSRHDAILIGVGTALADNPSLNCRLQGVGGYGGEGLLLQPRPIIVDPSCKWQLSEAKTKVLDLAKQGRGRAPYIICTTPPEESSKALLEKLGGKYINLGSRDKASNHSKSVKHLSWREILASLKDEGLQTVMIEGGGTVINDLLSEPSARLVKSVIITIAPVWLGQGGVTVCPPRRHEEGKAVVAARLRELRWLPMGDDVVLGGTLEF